MRGPTSVFLVAFRSHLVLMVKVTDFYAIIMVLLLPPFSMGVREALVKRKVAFRELIQYRKRMCIGTVSLTFAYRLLDAV